MSLLNVLVWKQIAPSKYRALCEDISLLYRGKEGARKLLRVGQSFIGVHW